MAEFDVSTPEGLKRFLFAEAELDAELYAEDMLRGFLQENKLDVSEYDFMLVCLAANA